MSTVCPGAPTAVPAVAASVAGQRALGVGVITMRPRLPVSLLLLLLFVALPRCLLAPSSPSGLPSKAATAAAQELLDDGLATKRTLRGNIDKGNVHVVEAAVAKWEEALAVYQAALPGGEALPL